jgi:hypothetical protein
MDPDESTPRVSMTAYSPTVEHAHHNEVSISRRIGKTNLQLAAYADRVSDPALSGVGEFTTDNGTVLPDVYSGTGFFPGHIEAIVDLRNLLAQGYVPVLGSDGHTVYLVQSARAVSGGVAFTF